MSVSFTNKFDSDIRNILKDKNKIISKIAVDAWAVAVRETPAPPTPSYNRYQRTGRLRASWVLSIRRSGLVFAIGRYQKPSKPIFNFDILKHKQFHLYNNVPYAQYVEEGTVHNVPRKMLFKAKIFFNSRLRRLL